MEVLISNRQKKVKLNTKRLRTIAEEIMKYEGLPENSELSIVFCDDDFIQKLNEEYLGINRPTDVLSFPIDDEEFEAEVRLIGDVVISTETAFRQAQKLRHAIGLEMVFLLIHGILHLLGHDHKTRTQMTRMKGREETLCRFLNEKRLLKGIEQSAPSTLITRAIKSKKQLG